MTKQVKTKYVGIDGWGREVYQCVDTTLFYKRYIYKGGWFICGSFGTKDGQDVDDVEILVAVESQDPPKVIDDGKPAYTITGHGTTIVCDDTVIVGSYTPQPVNVSAMDIDNIVCTAIEGGIGYWATIDRQKSEFRDKPKGMPLSSWVTKVLLDGKSVYFFDSEEEEEAEFEDQTESERFELHLLKLINGIKLNCQHRPHDCDIETGDATTADCIFQYAMFNEVVYG